MDSFCDCKTVELIEPVKEESTASVIVVRDWLRVGVRGPVVVAKEKRREMKSSSYKLGIMLNKT